MDVALQRSDETIERVAVPVDGLFGEVFHGVGHLRHCPTSEFSVARMMEPTHH